VLLDTPFGVVRMFQETVWNRFNIVMADLNVMFNSSIVGSRYKLFRAVPEHTIRFTIIPLSPYGVSR